MCRRWKVESKWEVPAQEAVMRGSKRVRRGEREFGLVDQMFGAMEWD